MDKKKILNKYLYIKHMLSSTSPVRNQTLSPNICFNNSTHIYIDTSIWFFEILLHATEEEIFMMIHSFTNFFSGVLNKNYSNIY